MFENVVCRVSRSVGFRMGMFLCFGIAALAVAVGGIGAKNFGSTDYTEFYCGAVIPPVRKTVTRPPVKGPVIVDVNMLNSLFDPAQVTINVGDTVRWTNSDTRAHTTTSNTGVWDSGSLSQGQTFSFTFTSAGTFPYLCTIHGATMTGSITVQSPGPAVTISGFAFDPPSLTINVGDTVTWTNNDGTGHSTTSDTGVWSSPVLLMGESFSFTFTSAGTFPYHCSPHPFMTASITVIGPSPSPTETATNTPTATPTANGTPSISGTVTYGNPASPTTKCISNALVASTIGSPPVSTTTGPPGPTCGQYTLTGVGSGNYTVGVTKTTGQNGIASGDAARVAQHVAGVSIIASNAQRVAADVTNNGALSSTDAANIARFVAGLGVSPGHTTNTWRFFVPPGPSFPIGASPTTRSYTEPIGVQTGQDYIGLLIGEVTGNWTPGPLRPAGNDKEAANDNGFETRNSVVINIPESVAQPNAEVIIPVNVEGAAGSGIISYEFDLRYDPSVIQPQAEPVEVAGTVSRGLFVVANQHEPGLLRVVVYGAMPIAEDGLLLNLKFTAVGSWGSASPLTFERIMFNEGEPRVVAFNSSVKLSAAFVAD